MRITIDIPDEIHAALKARAKQEGTTMRAIILRGVHALLNKRNPRFPEIKSKQPGSLALGDEGVYEYIPFP